MMIENKFNTGYRKDLQTLIEGYLEKDSDSFAKLSDDQSRELIYNLVRIFSQNESPHNRLDYEDIEDMDAIKSLAEWHRQLLPLWKKIKKALIDHRENKTDSGLERVYEIPLKGNSFSIDLYLDSGKIAIFRRDMNLTSSFLDVLKDAPLELFSICEYCGKVIILVRTRKKYCPGCAAKASQKDKWDKDPDGCRERERTRYKERRKRTGKQK
jgi:hypothetical protein